jgi:hypothetical protein
LLRTVAQAESFGNTDIKDIVVPSALLHACTAKTTQLPAEHDEHRFDLAASSESVIPGPRGLLVYNRRRLV